MIKLCFLDTETGGIEPAKHALLSVSMIIDIDGQSVAHSWRIQPVPGKTITPEAMAVNGLNPSEGLVSNNGYQQVINTLDAYISRYDRDDKLVLIGHNVGFDEQFMREFFIDNHNIYYGSYFRYPSLCTCALTHLAVVTGRIPEPPNYRLRTCCQLFGVPFDIEQAHGSDYDVAVTRLLFYKLLSRLGLAVRKVPHVPINDQAYHHDSIHFAVHP